MDFLSTLETCGAIIVILLTVAVAVFVSALVAGIIRDNSGEG